MKYLPLFLFATLLLGCTASPSGFDTYADQENHFSFDKPSNWTRQNDPLSLARFGDGEKMTFSVTYIPGNTSDQFEQAVAHVYTEFQNNNGLFNLAQESTTFAGFQAIKITSDQNLINETTRSLAIVQADLFIVKDTKYNRLLLVAFTGKKEDSQVKNVRETVLSSFKII